MSLDKIISAQKDYFLSDITKDIITRQNALKKLEETILQNQDAIILALSEDLDQSKEDVSSDIRFILSVLRHTLSSLPRLMSPHKTKTPFSLLPGKSYIMNEPYGVVLVIAPWNDPFVLTMLPLIGALSAGNCAVVKTSSESPHICSLFSELFQKSFHTSYVYFADMQVSYDTLLNTSYDYIFFTGSERAGRIILRNASEFLTPVTLELGGKNPCIIEESANFKKAALKIWRGKLKNAGQSCLAPDYVLVPQEKKEEFVSILQTTLNELVINPLNNEAYQRIANLHQFMRLKTLIQNESSVLGGAIDEKNFKIAPAIFPEVSFTSDIMKNEIMGPILPVLGYSDLEELISFLNHSSKPLAAYIFGSNMHHIEKIVTGFSFGGGCINDTMLHAQNPFLPFGGIGRSGMGVYHGLYTYQTFSHQKSILFK